MVTLVVWSLYMLVVSGEGKNGNVNGNNDCTTIVGYIHNIYREASSSASDRLP